MTARPTILLVTDFGLADPYVGVMKSVILSRCPADIIDISHDVAPQDVAAASRLIATAWPYAPAGAGLVCVVDPGVGTNRLPIAVQGPTGWFVGPDNGWLTSILPPATAAGTGMSRSPIPEGWTAVRLDNPKYQLEPVSRTFPGRDVFAPAAAALASGVLVESLGTPLDRLVTLELASSTNHGEAILGHVVRIDRFGNLITNIEGHNLPDRFTVTIANTNIRGRAESYQSQERFVAIIGSAGYLEIATPNGNAARALQVGLDESVEVRVETATEWRPE